MEAGYQFAELLRRHRLLAEVRDLRVDLYGSLAATGHGHGHGTLGAVLLGLDGHRPSNVEPATIDRRLAEIEAGSPLLVGGDGPFVRCATEDVVPHPLTFLERHANGMRFEALDANGRSLLARTSYSIGGGFLEHDPVEGIDDDEPDTAAGRKEVPIPFPFANAEELKAICRAEDLSVAEVAMTNECVRQPAQSVDAGFMRVWQVMEECADRAMHRTGCLPGGLDTRRRAPAWHARLMSADPEITDEYWMDWVNLIALAVNEENASGGRVITAPTNGAAGVLPATAFYALHYTPRATSGGKAAHAGILRDFLLAAGAIGSLIKDQVSMSGAAVGCEGEIGSASSMAAARLAKVLGARPTRSAPPPRSRWSTTSA